MCVYSPIIYSPNTAYESWSDYNPLKIDKIFDTAFRCILASGATFTLLRYIAVATPLTAGLTLLGGVVGYFLQSSELFQRQCVRPTPLPEVTLDQSHVVTLHQPRCRRTISLKKNYLHAVHEQKPAYDAVIDAVFSFLQHNAAKNGQYPVQVCYNELYPRHTDFVGKPLLVDCHLEEAQWLLIPRYVLNSHFTLVAVDMEKGIIHTCDPDRDVDRTQRGFVMRLQCELQADPTLRARFPARTNYRVIDETREGGRLPIQGESEEYCGYYICSYAMHLLGTNMPWSSLYIVAQIQNYLVEQLTLYRMRAQNTVR